MKLKNDLGTDNYYISNPREFKGASIPLRDIQKSLDFAYEMCFGFGHHRSHRTGGQYDRKNGEKFCNTFQGKLGEIVLYNYFTKNNISCNEPDFGIYPKGIWDNSDLIIYGQKINVKSVASQSNLLLLETKDWNKDGHYKPNLDLNNDSTYQYDYFILIRINPDIKKLFKEKKLMFCNEVEKKTIETLILDKSWTFDVAGYCTHKDVVDSILGNFILPQNSTLNRYTKMDAENYYIQSGDMKIIDNIIPTLKSIEKL